YLTAQLRHHRRHLLPGMRHLALRGGGQAVLYGRTSIARTFAVHMPDTARVPPQGSSARVGTDADGAFEVAYVFARRRGCEAMRNETRRSRRTKARSSGGALGAAARCDEAS